MNPEDLKARAAAVVEALDALVEATGEGPLSMPVIHELLGSLIPVGDGLKQLTELLRDHVGWTESEPGTLTESGASVIENLFVRRTLLKLRADAGGLHRSLRAAHHNTRSPEDRARALAEGSDHDDNH